MLKIGRNDLCPCGSGKKYKHCCIKRSNPNNDQEIIKNIVISQGYGKDVSTVINNMLSFMRRKNWLGACHASTSCLYIALKEIGYEPELCIGEVFYKDLLFDHSWIELDRKVIDLAISLPLGNRYVSDPIVLDIDVSTNKKHYLHYGVSSYVGLDMEAQMILDSSITEYMLTYPNLEKGLMPFVNEILPKPKDVDYLYLKYKDDYRKHKKEN